MKLIKYFLMLAIGCVALTACGGDDEDPTESAPSEQTNALVGRWVEISEDDSAYEVFNYQFNADGKGYFWVTYDGALSSEGRVSIKWSATSSVLKVDYGDEMEEYEYSIENDILTLSDEWETVSYRRVN